MTTYINAPYYGPLPLANWDAYQAARKVYDHREADQRHLAALREAGIRFDDAGDNTVYVRRSSAA